MRNQIARIIKTIGCGLSLILTGPQAARMALDGFEASKIGGQGYGFVLGPLSSCYDPSSGSSLLSQTGSIGVMEPYGSKATSYEEYEAAAIARSLVSLHTAATFAGSQLTNSTPLSGRVLLQTLPYLYDVDRQPLPVFNVVNIQNGKKIQIGTITDDLYVPAIDVPLLFPGGT